MGRTGLALLVLLSMLSVCRAEEPAIRIAKVDMRELEPLLLEVAFMKPENHGLRDRYAVSQNRERAIMSGEVGVDESMGASMMDMFELKQKVEDLARGDLILLIEAVFGDRYQVVVNDSFGGGVLYTELAIPDITPNIRQELLKRRVAEPDTPQGVDAPE